MQKVLAAIITTLLFYAVVRFAIGAEQLGWSVLGMQFIIALVALEVNDAIAIVKKHVPHT